MRFIFKPQTCILVAGLVAASYAEACYYQLTSATCFHSGDTVDYINFPSESPSSASVLATSDWTVGVNNVTTSNNGTQGYATYGAISAPTYCSGPAKFVDPSGHTDTANEWQNGSAYCGSGSRGTSCISFTVTGQIWGNVTGATCS